MKIMRLSAICCCAIFLALGFAVTQTWADQIVYFELGVPYTEAPKLTLTVQDYATVEIDVPSGQAVFTVTMNSGLTNLGTPLLTDFYFNTTLGTSTTTITGKPTDWGTSKGTSPDGSNFGTFTWQLQDPDNPLGPGNAQYPLTFTVLNSAITSASQFEDPNAAGYMFAIEAEFQGNGQEADGEHGEFANVNVPEPPSLLLVGACLVAFGIWRKKFRHLGNLDIFLR